LAGYRVGCLDTTGRMVFFNIDQLETGDVITLKDSLGGTYTHEVSEIFVVDPDADWAIDPVRGRDNQIIVVQADRARLVSYRLHALQPRSYAPPP
jgi:sortase (surface protein transpeptidase)